MTEPTSKTTVAGCLGPLLVLALLAGGGIYLFLDSRSSVDKAEVGECLEFDAGDDQDPYSRGDCADPAAAFKVYDQVASGASADCVAVPGTSRTVSVDGGVLCIGEKDVDLATTINDVAVGECVLLEGDEATRVPCSEPAALPVLAVLETVLKNTVSGPGFPSECEEAGATESTSTYSWGIESETSPIIQLTWDRVLCLGEPAAGQP